VTSNQQRIIIRSLEVWLLIIIAEMVHGILRAIFLVPIIGEFRSNQIGVFTGSAIILVIAYVTHRFIEARRTPEFLMVGIIWLVLTVAFEILFGRFVMGLSWERILADYNIAKGGLMPLGLVVMLLSPMIAARLHGRRQRNHSLP
jgi:hypothetical protein